MRPHSTAGAVIARHGASSSPANTSVRLKCMTVGLANAAPAAAVSSDTRPATSVMTTNCNPMSAPAAPPTIR